MSALEVAEVRLFPKKDSAEHHTDKYEPVNGATFLRRGQLFNVGIRFKSSYNPQVNRVYLEFFMGPNDVRCETSARMRVRTADDTKRQFPPPAEDWGARRFEDVIDNAIAVQVVSPVWLPVGKWQLRVRTKNTAGLEHVYCYPGHIYFLFNPWNKDDQTYFPDKNLLNEYILNDVAKIFKGNKSWQLWDYGQFEDCVLPAFELALEQKGELPHHLRGDPAKVARAISKVVNTMDSKTGILWGRWRDNFDGGKSPFYWRGSEEILRQFLKTEEPVRYGQCWVFAGVATTVCRALGIPARSVTNLGSGHDTDCSLTIDEFYDHDLNKISSKEMIWNFHCWTDVWMSRPQLSKNNEYEYDGWQTIDATPQEKSRGSYQLGPAPVSAVLRGHTQVSYDVPFVFTEVNGDKVRWQIRKDRKHRLIDVNTKQVGQMILTNEPLSNAESAARDITTEYKYPEDAAAERESVSEAIKNLKDASEIAKQKNILIQSQKNLNDVRFGANIPYEVRFGDDFKIDLSMTNTSKENRTVERTLKLVCADYKGNITATLLTVDSTQHITLKKEQGVSETMTFTAEDYVGRIQDNQYLKLIATCYVKETGQPWLLEDYRIEVCYPILQIQIEEELEKGKETTLKFSLDRSFDFRLTDCRLAVKGSKLAGGGGGVITKQYEDTPPSDFFYAEFTIRPQRAGLQKIFAKFTSAQLPKTESWIEVSVRESAGELTNGASDYSTLTPDSLCRHSSRAASSNLELNLSDKLWETLMQ